MLEDYEYLKFYADWIYGNSRKRYRNDLPKVNNR